ncbi:MAG: hypothetical protein D6805_08590 [Planctomycetota bacterium]|nr:MAG: hypothetical protein D6805_08590 [Planctomycetota bacterium]
MEIAPSSDTFGVPLLRISWIFCLRQRNYGLIEFAKRGEKVGLNLENHRSKEGKEGEKRRKGGGDGGEGNGGRKEKQRKEALKNPLWRSRKILS